MFLEFLDNVCERIRLSILTCPTIKGHMYRDILTYMSWRNHCIVLFDHFGWIRLEQFWNYY